MGASLDELISPGVTQLRPYLPGKPVEELERELGISNTIKLASNENPLGPSPAGTAAARDSISEINLYPDDIGFRLKRRLSEKLDVTPESLILGAGSSDVIDMVVRTFLGPGRNAVYSRHAFAMYPIYTTAVGAEGRAATPLSASHPEMPYGHDLDEMAALVDENTRVVFIANPNNPTGTWLQTEAVTAFLDSLPDHVIVVLDEAYIEYVEDAQFPDGVSLLQRYPNLIVTRTFSKIFGLAGLRVGYGIADPELTAWVSRVRHPFNVSLPALAAAEAALGDSEFLARSVEVNTQGKAQLQAYFAERQLACLPSAGNFLTFELPRSGPEVYEDLLREGVILRPLANYDMPMHLRVTIGSATENARFTQALDAVL